MGERNYTVTEGDSLSKVSFFSFGSNNTEEKDKLPPMVNCENYLQNHSSFAHCSSNGHF